MPQPKLCFITHIYRHDAPIAPRLFRQIRSHHPDATAIAINDGVRIAAITEACQEHDIHLIRGQRLKLAEFDGAWVERHLQVFLQTDATHLIRLDPDCQVWRPIAQIPDADLFANWIDRLPNMGCSGLSRRAAQHALQSRLLRVGRYTSDRFSYERFGKFKHEHEDYSTERILSADRVFANLAKCLQWTTADWPEVKALWRGEPTPEDYAVTHPHPLP